jgi:hypothetical protein
LWQHYGGIEEIDNAGAEELQAVSVSIPTSPEIRTTRKIFPGGMFCLLVVLQAKYFQAECFAYITNDLAPNSRYHPQACGGDLKGGFLQAWPCNASGAEPAINGQAKAQP